MADAQTIDAVVSTKSRSFAENLINAGRIILEFIVKLFSLPLLAITAQLERRRIENLVISERTKCPACGHKGCRLNFIESLGPEHGAVERTCYTCGAKAYSGTLVPVDRWMAKKVKTTTASGRQ